MAYKRRIRATELAGQRNERVKWYHLAALIAVGAIFFVFMERWRRDTGGERFQKAEEFSLYYRDFFIPYPKTYYLFEEKVPMLVKARNLGNDFFSRDFPKYITQSMNEVNEMLDTIDELRREDKKNERHRKRVSFSDETEVFNLIKLGKSLSKTTQFNIADGEILDFWDIAFRRHKKWTRAKNNVHAATAALLPEMIPSLKDTELLDTFLKKGAKSAEEGSKEELLKRIALLDKDLAIQVKKAITKKTDIRALHLLLSSLKVVKKSSVLPKMELLRRFIPYAKPEYITLDDKTSSVQIVNQNTAIEIKHFKYALFLRQLRKKLPKDFDYLMLLGDRHGMWHLPTKFQRWAIGIDDPFALLKKRRGVLSLYLEEGAFSVVRRREDHFSLVDDTATAQFKLDIAATENGKERSAVVRAVRTKYPSPDYLVDLTAQEVKKIYSRPVNWQTGTEARKYKSVVVIDRDPVRARMYGLSLFISDKPDVAKFEKNFPETVFTILNNDNTVFVPSVTKDYYLSDEQASKKEARQKKAAEALRNSKQQK